MKPENRLIEYCGEYTITVVYNTQKVEESFVLEPTSTIDGFPFTIDARGTLIHRGIEPRINDPQIIDYDKQISVWLKSVVPKLVISENTKQHCMNCLFWDRKEGIKQLTETTHTYKNTSYSRIDEIQRAIASHVETSPLTASNIGFCPKNNGSLRAETANICDHYSSRGRIAIIRNWWKRMMA